MDAPRHTKLRNIVNRGFTPRVVAHTEATVRQKARRIINAVCERGECDFVTDIAAALPLEIICDMMGIPPTDYKRIFELTNTIPASASDYAMTIEELMAAGLELAQHARRSGRPVSTPRRRISPPMHARWRVKRRPHKSSAHSSYCSWWPATRPRATPSVTA
jgi:cytochrome P450